MLFVSKFTAGLRIITLCAFTLIASGLQFDECYARGGQLRYERHRSIAYEFRKVTGIAVHVITINMNDPEVKVSIALAAGGIGTAEPFISMVERMHPVMAVTGTYFDLRTRIPVGTIVIDGRPVHISPIGTALAITPDNRVQMIDVRLGKPRDWSGYETVLLCGPRLLRNAQIKLYPRAQGFRAPNLFTYRRRIAVGWRPNNKLVIVATKRGVLLSQLARLMKALGCTEAMNLDGGDSSALYYRNRVLVQPKRWLTNVIIAYENVPPTARRLARLQKALGARTWDEFRLRLKAYEQAHAAYAKGVEAYRRGRYLDSLVHYSRAIELLPNSAAFHRALARAYIALGRKGDATAALVRAGDIYVSKGKIVYAIGQYRRAAALIPSEPMVHQRLAAAFRALGDYKRANKAQRLAELLVLSQAVALRLPANLLGRVVQELTRAPSRRLVRLTRPHVFRAPDESCSITLSPRWIVQVSEDAIVAHHRDWTALLALRCISMTPNELRQLKRNKMPTTLMNRILNIHPIAIEQVNPMDGYERPAWQVRFRGWSSALKEPICGMALLLICERHAHALVLIAPKHARSFVQDECSRVMSSLRVRH